MEGKLKSEVDELSEVNSKQFKTLSSSYKLIDKLTNLIKGTKPEIDNQSNKLRKATQKSEPIEKVSGIVDSLLELVVNAEKDQMMAIREVRDGMLSAGEALQKTKGLDDNLRRQLRMVVNRLKTGVSTYSEAQPLLISLLNILTSAKVSKENDAAPSSNKSIVKLLVQHLEHLSKQDNIIPNLHDKLVKINGAKTESEQLDLCLKTFYSIIDQFSEEFKQTQKLVLNINTALEDVHNALVQSLKSSKTYDKELKLLNIKIDKQIKELSQNAGEAKSIEQLRTLLSSKIENITESIKQREAIENKRTKELNSTLTVMESKLAKLEERTDFYRSKWLEEKSRSETDALTELPNRGAYDKRLIEEIQRSGRSGDSLCLAVIDIDLFKSINDKYGHSVGDKTLQIVSKSLRKTFRATDYVARYGGEEFVGILINTDPNEVLVPLEKVRKAIESIPFVIKKDRLNITISIGVTELRPTDDAESLFDRADKALYEAKQTGRNKICFN
jgi:diguanylate cyclase (GGDEF)-like protein